MSWDCEKVLEFIKEYEKREVLWNKGSKHYQNMMKKEDAWREISEILNEDIDMLKKKMNSLRGSRRREKSRMVKSINIGKGREDIYTPNWFAWESFKFLDDPEELRAYITNISGSESEDVDGPYVNITTGEGEENMVQDCLISRNEDTHVNLCENQKPAGKKFVSTKKLASRRKQSEDPRKDEAYSIMETTVGGQQKDECSLFSDYIAEKLRKMDNRSRALLQHEIHGLILQAEMKKSD